MSKKVKCLDCGECMRFAVPSKRVLEENPDMISRLKNNLVCGQTNKTKMLIMNNIVHIIMKVQTTAKYLIVRKAILTR